MRPTLLLVGSTHGAGKTTLADILGARLSWVVVSRDRVRGGMASTQGEQQHVPTGDLSRRAVSAFYELITVLLARSSSVIAESGFRRGVSEADLRPLQSTAALRLVHCAVPRAVAIDRCRSTPGPEFTRRLHGGACRPRPLHGGSHDRRVAGAREIASTVRTLL